ncbi:MAG: hypothetical protein JNN07_12455 [Verrucomicrobiales bacterium]|nr:hypothetical protein [Verrucomicrobiales bacterium]
MRTRAQGQHKPFLIRAIPEIRGQFIPGFRLKLPAFIKCRCGLDLPAVPPRIVCPGCNAAYIHDQRTGRWFPSFAWPSWTQVTPVVCLTLAVSILAQWGAWPAALVAFLMGVSIALWDRTRRLKFYNQVTPGLRPWWLGVDRMLEGLDLMWLVLLLGAPLGLFLGWLIWRAWFA